MHEFCVVHSFFHFVLSKMYTEENAYEKLQYFGSYIASRKKEKGQITEGTTEILHKKNKAKKRYCKPRKNP